MRTQLLSKYPWKSSRESLRIREPQVENHQSVIHTTAFTNWFCKDCVVVKCARDQFLQSTKL